MILKKSVFASFVLIFIFQTGLAQTNPISKIDVADLKRHLIFIASDSLQGRRLGTPVNGLDITARYIAENISKTGLKSATDNYFQEVTLFLTRPIEDGFLEVCNPGGKRLYRSKSVINISGGIGVTDIQEEEIILAGFGWQDSLRVYDDLKQENFEKKVVIIAQGNPETFKNDKNIRWDNKLERAKIERIIKNKPKAIIFITNPNDKENKTYSQISRRMNRRRYALKPSSNHGEDVLTMIALPELADKILGKKGSYSKYLHSITKNNDPNTFAILVKKLNIKTGTTVEPVDAKNVIGFMEGSHPVLKNEYVVFMAHYDHLGIDNNGDVYNGADDNGSGTVLLMELAEAFMSMDPKPERSIVFLWVTSEEIGLFGSEYYTHNPVFPLDKTVACINIDMAGRVYEPRDSVWKRSPKMVKDMDGIFTLTNDVWPELNEICNSCCAKLGLIPDNSLPSKFLRSSDHYHFHNNGVPILNVATGYHADYHEETDEVSRINFEKLKRVTEFCFLVGEEIANNNKIDTNKLNTK